MQSPRRVLLTFVPLFLAALFACAQGTHGDDALDAPASAEQNESATLPPPSSGEDASTEKPSASSSSGGSSSGSSTSSSSSSSSSTSSSSSSSSSSGGTSSSSSGSSSGAAGGACPSDLSYYVKALDELSKPTPLECPCTDASLCCYGGLVCVAL